MKTPSMAAALGAELRRLREERRLSTNQVAQRLRINRPNVVRNERGQYLMSLRTLARYAHAFDVPLSAIVAAADAAVRNGDM